jgi:hypothetical protein
MTDPGIGAHADDLAIHAATIDLIVEELDLAVAAIDYVRLHLGAYGHLLGFLPGLLDNLQGMVEETGKLAVSKLSDSSKALHTAAGSLTQGNTDALTTMQALNPQVPQ